jgi:endonuclease YncB( thermonuclease family)
MPNKLKLTLALAASTCGFANAHPERDVKGVEYIRAVDGDTVEVNIRGLHPVFGENLKVRLADIDAPEMRTKNECEKRLANIAKQFVHNYLANANRIALLNPKRGTFFRVITDIKVTPYKKSSISLVSALLAEKLAVPYQQRNTVDWCKLEQERSQNASR